MSNRNIELEIISKRPEETLAKIKHLESELDQANLLLSEIYQSGSDLNELEDKVRDYLTKQPRGE